MMAINITRLVTRTMYRGNCKLASVSRCSLRLGVRLSNTPYGYTERHFNQPYFSSWSQFGGVGSTGTYKVTLSLNSNVNTSCSASRKYMYSKLSNSNNCLLQAPQIFSGNMKTLNYQHIHDSTSRKEERKENIYTIPNLLTIGRFAIAPVLGYMVVCEKFGLSCGLFVIAGITDLLDGYIARRWTSQSSVLGTIIDPLADKFLVTILCVSLSSVQLLPIWLTALILSRDVYLVLNGFRVRYVTLPPPKTFKRYFDFSHPTASVQPTLISKVNTNLQMLLLTLSLAAPVFDFVNHPGLHMLWGFTAATTTWSFVSYVRNSGYTVLK